MPAGDVITLASPVKEVPGIGPKRAAALLELGIRSVGQLVGHLPMRHERLEAESRIEDVVPGANSSARGTVTATRVVRKGRAGRFEAVLVDDTGRLDLVWFNGTYLHDKIKPGVRLLVQGKPTRYGPMLRMTNPSHQLLPEVGEEPGRRQERLRPVYPASAEINSQQIEQAVAAALPRVMPLLHDHLPEAFRKDRELPTLAEAYRSIHQPRSEGEIAAGVRRLAYDELLMLQLALAMKRAWTRSTTRALALRWTAAVDRHIRERFPFALTEAQDRVVREIAADLQRAEPMNRLVQGDVGSGKTVVALYAMLMAAAGNKQAALMAPTETLAEQHFRTIGAMMRGSGVRLELLTGSVPPTERAGIVKGLKEGTVHLVLGTHALLTEGVAFKDLAVVVIDEQHKFGVHQRMALRDKGGGGAGGTTPHVMVMTATPIPRTVAMTVFGDLDVSVIDKLPPGRGKMVTRVVGYEKSADVYGYVRQRIERGEQAYVVAPAIDARHEEELFEDAAQGAGESGSGGAEETGTGRAGAGESGSGKATGAKVALPRPVNVTEVLARLEGNELRGKRLAVVHGRLPSAARDELMTAFRAGRIDALVATTVIEVGVDVPNATMMVVEDADRFGLATLHQLRGRVGRGGKGGLCVLLAKDTTMKSSARLAVMAETSDGFKVAQRDVEVRGYGDVIGVRQSGMPPFKVVDLSRDMDLLSQARRDAEKWIGASPALDKPEEKLLRQRVLKQHGKWLGMADVG
ncbi:MAG: ATP-dependent DNA helicase RecG [Phycisphaerales bacterium]|nr:ATP-dependent DNA helicase RecG [Phycisphaerales bacterium]